MDTVLIDGIVYSLKDLEKDCWIKIFNGALRAKDPFHNPVVSNVNEHGINSRIVVLRKADVAKKTIFFHTDIRSGKWKELQANHKISCLFYDMHGRVQIRIAGSASLHHTDNIADEAWAKSSMSSRKIYLGKESPSSKTTTPVSGVPAEFETDNPTEQESEVGRKNFGVACITTNWMEWLWLNSKGHRRASFFYENAILAQQNWLIP